MLANATTTFVAHSPLGLAARNCTPKNTI